MGTFSKIPEGAIKTPIPKVKQKTCFSCGSAALHSICVYWGVGPKSEYDYIKHLQTDEAFGTLPNKIIKFAKSKGLIVEAKHEMTIHELISFLDGGKPVIVLLQAWGNLKKYKGCYSGHYVVAIGYDDTKIYFEDPLLHGQRGYLTKKQFCERWIDYDALGNYYYRYGIAIWKEESPIFMSVAKKID